MTWAQSGMYSCRAVSMTFYPGSGVRCCMAEAEAFVSKVLAKELRSPNPEIWKRVRGGESEDILIINTWRETTALIGGERVGKRRTDLRLFLIAKHAGQHHLRGGEWFNN